MGKNIRSFEQYINESYIAINEKEETYSIMRFQNGRTKEMYGPGTVQQLARGFNLDSALEIHPEFGNMDMGRNIRGKKFKVEDIETIEELIKILNFAQELKEKTPKPKNTYEIWESANENINEAAGNMTYLFYNVTPKDAPAGWTMSPSKHKKTAQYLGVGNNYTVGIADIEDTKGRTWKAEVFICGDVDLGDDRNHIGNTRYAPDGAWQGKGTPTEKPDGWDFTSEGKPLMIVDGVEVYIAKIGKVG